ncbi:Inositol monophosphatase [Candidatus Omnitrophus magneticus]|uniref:Inositol-1-monophosphatase n=1 Tax=Candidatus Omnitrophus magneticus TaxID=1609969 RepID=A0A0F0CUT4_9BACT|nr:Inositol monophosphatase [Candidatus Omnitrophus magneticus]
MNELFKIKKIASIAAKEAGSYAIEKLGHITEIIRKRGHNDLVTDVDKSCENIVIKHIKNNFPNHSILAEESGKSTGKENFTWVIDPIDGTTNYAHGFPFFCTSIGILYDGNQVAGVVYDPNRKELFSAIKGNGAFLNSKKINVSSISDIKNSLLATGFAYDATKAKKGLDDFAVLLTSAQAVRRAGAAAIDLCYVACGRFDGFWEIGLAPWDTAAASLILEEAGGKITILNGKKFDIFDKEILATNGKIHNQMTVILKKTRADENNN